MIDRNTYNSLYWASMRKIARYLEMSPDSLAQLVHVKARCHSLPGHRALYLVRASILRQLRHG